MNKDKLYKLCQEALERHEGAYDELLKINTKRLDKSLIELFVDGVVHAYAKYLHNDLSYQEFWTYILSLVLVAIKQERMV